VRPSLLLRIASVLTLLYCAGHVSGMPWTPVTGPSEVAVLDAMKAQRFAFAGVSRTYWDFYYGFGVAIIGYLLVQGVVLWQVAALARNDAIALRPIILTVGIGFLINAVVVGKYFFAIPLVFAIAITITLGLAFFTAGVRPTRA
jgi:hypothetical protein